MALLIVLGLLCVPSALCGFSTSTSFSGGFIQQNSQKTWCYYPSAGLTTALSCGEDYSSILAVHLKQQIAIGYYSPDGTRYGGAEWAVPLTNPGKIYLCASGRVGDGSYQTFCGEPVTADNSIPGASGDCLVAKAQDAVSDGCYVPSQAAASPPASPTIATIPSPSPDPSHILSGTTYSSTTASPASSSSTTTSNPLVSPSTSTNPGGGSNGRDGLGIGDRLGIVFGIISALSLLFGIFKWWRKHSRRNRHPIRPGMN
ncbi:hypothetical protein DL96DRAFT_1539737 [Flagelloscypha sp. PMI_526]|nr:hypothetical protein DL96DRAFT_1539737 [Flagelloscypha sp. PMI_526]